MIPTCPFSENVAVMADFFPPRRDRNQPSGFLVNSMQFLAGKERWPAAPLLGLERLREPGLQELAQLRRGLELWDGVQFFECRRERIGKTPDRPRPEFLILRLEVEVMYGASEVFGSFESALDECLVDHHLGGDVRQFTQLPCFYLLPHRLEVPLHTVDAD